MKRAVFDKLMKRIEDSFTVSLIAQPMKVFQSDQHVEIEQAARESRFSRIPFLDRNDGRLMVQGFDSKRGFAPVAAARAVTHEELIVDSTSIVDIIRLLAQQEYFFVLVRDRICMVVTRSDLNHLPVRTYLFSVLVPIGSLLAEWIRASAPNDDFMHTLSESRQAEVSKLHAKRCKGDSDTSLLDCTTLTDKFNVVSKNPAMYQRLGFNSKSKFDDAWFSILRLRNRLHHGQTALPLHSASWVPSDMDDMESDALRDAIAHNGQLIVDSTSTEWLHKNVSSMHQLITLIPEC